MKKFWKLLAAVLGIVLALSFVGCSDDDDDDDNNTEKGGGIASNEMALEFTFAETLDAASVEVLYYPGDGDSADGVTVSAKVENNKASVTLSDAYTNDYDYINAKITVKDTADTDISDTIQLTSSSGSQYDFGGNCSKAWFKLIGGATLAVSGAKKDTTEKFMTLTLNFAAEIGATSVKVHYYKSDINDVTDEDGKIETLEIQNNTATLQISNTNATEWGCNARITVFQGETDVTSKVTLTSTAEGFGGAIDKCWFKFVADGTAEMTFKKDAVFSLPYTSDTITVGAETYTKILSADVFKNLTVKRLIVKITSKTENAWASLSAASSWTDGLYIEKAINTEKTITDETFIKAVLENGLYMETSAGDFVVEVKYSEEEEVSEYTVLGTETEVTFGADNAWWNLNTDFSEKGNISAIKIVATISEKPDGAWICYTDATEWKGNFTPTDSGFEAIITDSDVIESIVGEGGTINLYGTAEMKVNVSVYYSVATAE